VGIAIAGASMSQSTQSIHATAAIAFAI